MTKRDGDRLRAIKAELLDLESDYGADSVTGAGFGEIGHAIDLALQGLKFEARCTDPKTGRILKRHEIPEARAAALRLT